MKSYFAKLAARATLSNTPVPRPSIVNSRDPFEQTAIEPIAPPSAGLTQSGRHMPPTITNVSFDAPAGNRERRRQETDHVETGPRKISENLTPTRAETATATSRATPLVMSDRVTPIDLPRTEKHLRPEALKSKQLPDTIELPPQVETWRSVPAVSRKDDVPQSLTSGPKERLDEIEEEQTVLLRKADAFMAGLFSVRAAAAKQESDTEEVKRTEPAKLVPPDQSSTQLQPVSRPARVTDPVDDEPSLVIENLSVEVLSPAPTQVSPPQRIIVVGGSRQPRDGAPSSQRFGFSRF